MIRGKALDKIQHAFMIIKNLTKVGTEKHNIIKIMYDKPSAKKNTQEKKAKREQVKLSLYAENVLLYIENPKDSTQKLLELINKFSKVTVYKINIKKSLAFLFTGNEILEKK